jgi:hypothetical protein
MLFRSLDHGSVSVVLFVSQADTRVEMLLIHKVVFQTFRIQDSFLRRLQLRSTVYPSNLKIIEEHKQAEQWETFREDLLLYTPKERWPVAKSRIRNLGGGRSIVSMDARDQESLFSKFTLV